MKETRILSGRGERGGGGLGEGGYVKCIVSVNNKVTVSSHKDGRQFR